jgi:flagellar biosynthesis anti-sigma factor FlgM
MKITRTEITPLTSRSSFEAPAEKKIATSKDGSRPETTLSPELQELNQAKTLLTSTSDIDMDKVSAIRQALAEGNLPLDMDALSNAIMEMHR